MPHTDHTKRTMRHTYLLSLWQEGTTWRAALRPADGRPRQGFGDLEQLVAFLLRLQDAHTLVDPPGPMPEGGKDEHEETGRHTSQSSAQT
jgi:hypothetical protein